MKVNIKETNIPKFGDYQFDACIQISRRLSGQQCKISPQEVAQKILDSLEKIDFVEKV
jgi:arginyl-tRNA synthetase